MTSSDKPAGTPRLLRSIGVLSASAIIITTMIGTGVFVKARTMICNVGTPELVLLAYVVAGLLTLAGALVYAELSTLIPRAAGPYNYIGAAFGRVWAFLYGWMSTFIDGAAGIAALAIVFVIFFNDLLGGTLSAGASAALVAATLVSVTVLNLASVQANGTIATLVTGLKVALLIGIAVCAFVLADGSWSNFGASGADGSCESIPMEARMGLAGFGAAIIGALWSYSGASVIIFVAEEVRDPGRVLPRSMISATLILIGLYLLVNAAYFYVLAPIEIASVSEEASVAGEVIARIFGAGATTLMAAALMLSSYGSLHSSMLSTARVPFAMARDGLMPAVFAKLSDKSHVPVYAVLLIGGCAIAFASSGTFDVLTDMVVFTVLIFEVLAVAAVFVLRRRLPDAPRPYRVWGYPVIPAIYLLAAISLTLNTLWALPGRSLAGLAVVALGLPVYLFYARGMAPEQPADWLGTDQA